MHDLNEVFCFTKVVQAGSFIGASRLLGVPKSTISAKVAQLEKRLGVSLLQRTTRKLNLTEAGEAYFRRCVPAIEEIQAAEEAATSAQAVPQGLLRVTGPIELGTNLFPAILNAFMKKHPQVQVEFLFTDRFVDLVAEGVDLAIRAGELEDSSLMARKLGVSSFFPVASPKYLKLRGEPKTPKDLSNHDCLVFTTDFENHWDLLGPRGEARVPIRAPIRANSLLMIQQMVLSGFGIALLPQFFFKREVEAGRLVQVLPGWSTGEDPIHIVYPAQKFLSPKVRAFIPYVVDAFETMLKD